MKIQLCKETEQEGQKKKKMTLICLNSNFWSIMKAMEPKTQRKLLMFVTGSDRIPATGATQMNLKITCGNNGDSDR
jgi:E3 ubiquitin-protein ligase HECTD2